MPGARYLILDIINQILINYNGGPLCFMLWVLIPHSAIRNPHSFKKQLLLVKKDYTNPAKTARRKRWEIFYFPLSHFCMSRITVIAWLPARFGRAQSGSSAKPSPKDMAISLIITNALRFAARWYIIESAYLQYSSCLLIRGSLLSQGWQTGMELIAKTCHSRASGNPVLLIKGIQLGLSG